MSWRIGGLICMGTLLAACGSLETPADEPPITVFAPYLGVEADLLATGLAQWSDASGREVRLTTSGDFVVDLTARVYDLADPPDIAIVPQPGLVAGLHDTGHLEPLDDGLLARVRDRFDPEALALGVLDDVALGLPFRLSAKGLVWYRPDVFAELGIEVPQTLTELEEIVDRFSGDETSPWCLGLEAQSATGWVATDWVEDLIARQWGTDVYDGWVAGDVAFGDERIAASFDLFDRLALGQGRVYGGQAAIFGTNTRDAVAPLFDDPPGCLMHKQASFVSGWMPAGTEFGPGGDVDFFVLPSVEPDDAPLLAGVDLAIAFDRSPEVLELLDFLATPAAVEQWASGGSFISPLRGVGDDFYGDADRAAATLLADAEVVLVDGSDAMPVEVGSTLFWRQITDWVAGASTYEQLASAMDTARVEP